MHLPVQQTSHRVIAIVGAGFSGVALAYQFLLHLRHPAEILLINRNHRFGRGLAYGTRSASHLLNVPAGRMSLDPGDADGFVRFLRNEGTSHGPADFVPRKLYGEYLERALEQAQALAAPQVRLRLVQAEVADLASPPGARTLLKLGDGGSIAADQVVLALGNFAPRWPDGVNPGATAHFIGDPWAPGALDGLGADARVLLLGSGLTAFDVLLGLSDRGHSGAVRMISRRGLIPQPHRVLETSPDTSFVTPAVLRGRANPRERLRLLRSLIRAAGAGGRDWRDVIGALRPHTPELWSQLDERGRRQFLRHLLPYWDTHRHRAAPEIHARVEQAIRARRVVVTAGRIASMELAAGEGVRVGYRPRGAATLASEQFDFVVNCTGPSSDLRRASEPLIRALLVRGLETGSCGLGIEVDDGYRVHLRGSERLQGVYYVGPLLRARYWEATAVPELRWHAQELVRGLLRPEE